MFAFAAAREYRDQRHSEPLRATLRNFDTQTLKDEAMNTKGARIEMLSKLLLAVARLHAADEIQARGLAHTALERLLAKDPELDHFWQVVGVLRDELETRIQTIAEPPLRAAYVAA